MTDINEYYTISGESTGIFRDRGSKFEGYVRPVATEEEAEIFFQKIKSLHPKARHHCFAWRMGHPDPAERVSDDGEPSGTAGRPILGQLVRLNVTNVMLIVVRYFGGTLLGTGGLIHAYKTCAEETLKEVKTMKIVKKEDWLIGIDFSIVYLLEEWAPRLDLEILERDHGKDRMTYHVRMERSRAAEIKRELLSKLLGIYPEEVDMDQEEHGPVNIRIA